MTLQFKRLFTYIENLRIGWLGIFLIAGIIILIRIISEPVFDQATIFSYWTLIYLGSWFFSIFIVFFLLTSVISKIPTIKCARLFLVGLPVILIPIFGLIFGDTRSFDFLHGTWSEIFFHLITLAAFYPPLGIFFTIELILFLTALFIFFYVKTKSIARAIFSVIGIYSILTFFAIQPKIINDTWVNLFFLTNLKITQLYAIFNFFLLLFFGLLFFLREKKVKAESIVFHLRPERSFSLITFAVFIALGALNSPHFYLINFLSGFSLFIFFLFYAAVSNDAADLAIDKISNPNRPYAKGVFNAKEMKILQGVILGIIIILVLIIDSMPILILTLVNIGLSILYSVFRFRKFLFSHLIAAAGESTVVLYGYFAQMPTSSSALVEAWILFFAVFVFFAFFLPVKDLKDFAGDKKEKVRNFLTVFGWQKGKIITAISVFFAFIFFAFIMGGPLFFALSFIFAGLGAYFVVYYERIGEKASYLNFLIFIVLFLLFSFA